MIYGNTLGIRESLLNEMETLYELEINQDEFVTTELCDALARYSCTINREISVYISRDGVVIDVTIGGLESVELKEMRKRRNLKRLSMVRCVHTHPGGDPYLSDVDLSSLKSMRFDAMASIGVRDMRATGIQVAFLGECVQGIPQPIVFEPVKIKQIDQKRWMEEITLSDARVLRGETESDSEEEERAYLVGMDSEKSLDELAQLAKTAGAIVIGRAQQKRSKPDGATYIGSGKVEWLALECQAQDISIVIFDDELTGAQIRNLERALMGVKVVDRSALILDIFAQRAQSREGRLQVELAQLSYQLPRLIGHGISMSRLGGGIGTRGPGETRLEVDRRRIRKRMTDLKAEIEVMKNQRSLRRQKRTRSEVPVAALVGYTNTGKSTLLNCISDAGVLAEDKLFATLDPVTRNVRLPMGGEFLLVDTVGFISKLPHSLVDAFRSTLEEAVLADVLLIVSDASSDEVYQQYKVVREVLESLGAGNKPVIDVLNKMDKAEELPHIPGGIPISAKSGEGIGELMDEIAKALLAVQQPAWIMIPYDQSALVSALHDAGRVMEESYEANGTRVKAMLDDVTRQMLVKKIGIDAVTIIEG